VFCGLLKFLVEKSIPKGRGSLTSH
jgi:hypothetical protein